MRVRIVLNRQPQPIEGEVGAAMIGQGLGLDVKLDEDVSVDDDRRLFVPWTSIAYVVRNPKPVDPDSEPF